MCCPDRLFLNWDPAKKLYQMCLFCSLLQFDSSIHLLVLGDVAHHRCGLSWAEPYPVLGSSRPAHRPLVLQQHVPSSSSHCSVWRQSAALLSSSKSNSQCLFWHHRKGFKFFFLEATVEKNFESFHLTVLPFCLLRMPSYSIFLRLFRLCVMIR